MFGPSLIVVGNLPNTKLAAAVNKAAAVGEEAFVDRCKIIHVRTRPWLGDWLDDVDACYDKLSEAVAIDEALAETHPNGFIPGADTPQDFFLDIHKALETLQRLGASPTRRFVAELACTTLVQNTGLGLKHVYGVVMDEDMYTRVNNWLMLEVLWKTHRLAGINFAPRVYVVRNNGDVHMRRLDQS